MLFQYIDRIIVMYRNLEGHYVTHSRKPEKPKKIVTHTGKYPKGKLVQWLSWTSEAVKGPGKCVYVKTEPHFYY